MKAINITPKVYQLMVDLKEQGVDASRYTLERALEPELVQVFKEADSKYFWFESHNAPKYSLNHLRVRISRHMKLVYRDDWKREKNSAAKAVAKQEEPKDEKDLHLASPDDLKLFIKKYMKDYKMSARFKIKDNLEGEAMADFFAEVGGKYTAGISAILNAIYGGKKPNYRNKNRMSDEDRKSFNAKNREEFEWLLDNLIWLAKPSDKYLAEHKKFSTANYVKVSADLRSCVSNSLYHYRSFNMF